MRGQPLSEQYCLVVEPSLIRRGPRETAGCRRQGGPSQEGERQASAGSATARTRRIRSPDRPARSAWMPLRLPAPTAKLERAEQLEDGGQAVRARRQLLQRPAPVRDAGSARPRAPSAERAAPASASATYSLPGRNVEQFGRRPALADARVPPSRRAARASRGPRSASSTSSSNAAQTSRWTKRMRRRSSTPAATKASIAASVAFAARPTMSAASLRLHIVTVGRWCLRQEAHAEEPAPPPAPAPHRRQSPGQGNRHAPPPVLPVPTTSSTSGTESPPSGTSLTPVAARRARANARVRHRRQGASVTNASVRGFARRREQDDLGISITEGRPRGPADRAPGSDSRAAIADADRRRPRVAAPATRPTPGTRRPHHARHRRRARAPRPKTLGGRHGR